MRQKTKQASLVWQHNRFTSQLSSLKEKKLSLKVSILFAFHERFILYGTFRVVERNDYRDPNWHILYI